MTHFSSLARYIVRSLIRRRSTSFIIFTLIALLLAQPLFVQASPVTRGLSQVANFAQITASPEEESPDETNEGDDRNDGDTVDEKNVDEENVSGGNIEEADAEATSVNTINIDTDGNTLALPVSWQGDNTVPAEELVVVSPPLQAEVLQGDFQITYVPGETDSDPGGVRILPVASTGTLGTIRLGVTFDEDSETLPFPAGQTLLVMLSSRVYAPDAQTTLTIADDSGSSSVAIEGLNWNNYQVARQIAGDATSLEVRVEWNNAPPNSWLEIRDFTITLVAAEENVDISPTDTPAVIAPVTIAPTAPLAPTSTPFATAAALPTATPVPDTVVGIAPPAAEAPVAESLVPIPTATLIVVTSTPTPVDIFQEATRVAQATEWARILGPATATPPNLATETPTVTPFVVTNTPMPENAATATFVALYEAAVALTTGTPTPLPLDATVMVATATPVPPTPEPPTSTPVFVLLDTIPTAAPVETPPVPQVLYNKIVFLTYYLNQPWAPNAMVINPDGTEPGLLVTNQFYYDAAGRDSWSADKRFHVFSIPEAGGEAHNAGRFQVFYDDVLYDSLKHQLTYFGAGAAWAASHSPIDDRVALVSSDSGNDEIWVVQRNQWPGMQLTKNDWEWDHHPSFSPDGTEIVFSSNRVTGRRQLWIMSSDGSNQRQLTNFPFEAWDPVWIKYIGPEKEIEADSQVDP